MKIAILFALFATAFCVPTAVVVEEAEVTSAPVVPVVAESNASSDVVEPVLLNASQNEVIPEEVVVSSSSSSVAPVVSETVVSSAAPVESSSSAVPSSESPAAEQYVDPSVVLSDPIDDATKLLVELEEVVIRYVPVEPEEGVTTLEPQLYAVGLGDADVRQQGEEVNNLIQELDNLNTRLHETIESLTQRRRYVLAAMLRPMVTYVRRVRSNLERLQTRLNALQAQADAQNSTLAQRPSIVDSAAIENIRRRVEEVQRRVGDIVGRIRGSLAPTSTVAPSIVSNL